MKVSSKLSDPYHQDTARGDARPPAPHDITQAMEGERAREPLDWLARRSPSNLLAHAAQAFVMGALLITNHGSLQAADPALKVELGTEGLSALDCAGTPFLADGQPRVVSVTLESSEVKEGDRQYTFTAADVAKPDASFDGASQQLTQKFPWGVVIVDYTTHPDRLDLAVTITNTSPQTVADFNLNLLELKFPTTPKEFVKNAKVVKSSLDNLPLVTSTGEDWKLVAVGETMWPPVRFGLEEGVLVLRGGVPATEPGAYFIYPHGLPRVAPGGSLTWRCSLRLTVADAPLETLIAEVASSFRQYHQPALNWPDRRPIGMLCLSSAADIHRSTTNPRGWFNEPKIDVTTEAGREDFRQRALQYAARAVTVLTNLNAQGGIVWDLEGSENPHPTTYVGDPRLAKTLAPEMDAVADEFFQKFRDAKLRTGICIRPSQVYFDEEKKQWRHNAGNDGLPNRGGSHYGNRKPADLATWKFFPVVERLADKIAYAKKRWGCTIFYVDTNGVFQPVGEEHKFEWTLVQANMWQRLREMHPDVLIVPELVGGDGAYHAAYWAFTAPYGELDMGNWTTPTFVRALLPSAFSVLNMSDGDFVKHHDEIVAAVKRGDILMAHGWWWPNRNDDVKRVYEEVYPGFMEKGDQATIRGAP